MNQFPEKTPRSSSAETVRDAQIVNPPVTLPAKDANHESKESPVLQQEPNIGRATGADSGFPILSQPDSQNFDAQDFARISGESPVGDRPVKTQPSGGYQVGQFGEIDPYVDPSELAVGKVQNSNTSGIEMTTEPNSSDFLPENCKNRQLDSANRTMAELEDYQQQLEMLELHSGQQQFFRPAPIVEVIESNPMAVPPMKLPSENTGPTPDEEADDRSPPVTWFADNDMTESTRTATSAPQIPMPIESSETGEPVFDVRDFCDSANGFIHPIPGSFEVDPELFDFKTIDELETPVSPGSTVSPTLEPAAEPQPPSCPVTDDQVHIVGAGDVIQINGNDGYDHIDLACFDVQSATFSKKVIQIDDHQGSAFEIHYQDIPYALFADGVEVRLDADHLE